MPCYHSYLTTILHPEKRFSWSGRENITRNRCFPSNINQELIERSAKSTGTRGIHEFSRFTGIEVILFFLFLFWNNPAFGYSASVRRSLSWLIKNAAPRSHMHSSSKQAPAERAGKNRGSCKGKPKYSALMFLLSRRFIAFVLQFSHVARTHACAWRLRVQ